MDRTYILARFTRITILFLALLLTSCSKDADDITGVQRLPVAAGENLFSVYFINDSIGFAAGGKRNSYGFIFRTTNGGQTWYKVYDNPKRCIFAIGFNKAGKGFAGGDYLQLDTSDDLGLTWHFFDHGNNVPVNEFDRVAFRKFSFVENHVYVAGGEDFKKGIFYHSSDNGLTWNFQYYANEMTGIWFTDTLKGFFTGNGLFLTTSDGGQTFSPAGPEHDFFTSVWFTSPTDGFCATYNGALYATTDGGKTWETRLSGNNVAGIRTYFNDLLFTDHLNGYIACDDGLIVRTKDGGKTWNYYSVNTKARLTSISSTSRFIFMAGTDGYVYMMSLNEK